MSKKALFGLCMLLSGGLVSLKAQDYTGISGLVHVPTAEIQPEGEARFGSYYLNSHFLPDNFQHTDIGRYNTFNYFLALAPFSWMEISYVCTFFKNETGQTLNQYLTEYRMEKANQLLADPRYKITDISSRVGYSDGNYFGKSFKKYTGFSPSEYREKMS